MVPRVVARRVLRPGAAGLNDTLETIRREIDKGGRDWAVRREAELLTRHVAAHDYDGQIRAIYEGILGPGRPPYRRDPVNVELVKSARAMLDGHGGDCDDFTVLAGALFESLGFRVRPVVWGASAPVDGLPARFSHVYLEVEHPRTRRWVPFDVVLRNRFAGGGRARAGHAPPGGVKSMLVSLPAGRRAVVQDAIVDGIFEDISKGLSFLDFTDPKNTIVRGIVSAVPQYGAAIIAAGDAAAAGRQMVKAATGIDVSNVGFDIAKNIDKELGKGDKKAAPSGTTSALPTLKAAVLSSTSSVKSTAASSSASASASALVKSAVKAPASGLSLLAAPKKTTTALQIISKPPVMKQLQPLPSDVKPAAPAPVQTSAQPPAKSNTGLIVGVVAGVAGVASLAYALTR